MTRGGEVELMVAEEEERRSGKGYEACLAMITYGGWLGSMGYARSFK